MYSKTLRMAADTQPSCLGVGGECRHPGECVRQPLPGLYCHVARELVEEAGNLDVL